MNLINELKKEKSIVVCKDELRSYILSFKNSDPYLNFKIYTLRNLQKAVFGETNEETIKEVFHELKDFALAKKYIKYITSGISLSNNSEKIDEYLNILAIKEKLESKKLIYKDETIKFLFDKPVFFVGFSKENLEILHLIKILNIKNYKFIQVNELFNEKDYNATQFLRFDEAIKYAFEEINYLLNNGVSHKDIMVLTNVEENSFYLELYSKLQGISLHKKSKKTLCDTKISKILENELDNLSITNISNFDDGSDVFKQIVNVLTFYNFFGIGENKVRNYRAILKTITLDSDEENEGILVSDTLNYVENKHIFVLGFDNNFYLNVTKNNDFLDDDVKKKLNLNPTTIINMENSLIYEYFIYLNNDLRLYYFENNGDRKEEVSFFLLKKYGEKEYRNHLERKNVHQKEYSYELARNYYSYYNFMKRNYKDSSTEYYLYDNVKEISNNLLFDPRFKPFTWNEKIPSISYSKLENFFSCPFKFFCDSILGFDEFEDNFYTKSGTFIHEIFEEVYNENFDFDEVSARILSKNEIIFNEKESLLLEKVIKNAKIIAARLIEEKNNSYIKKTLPEAWVEVNYKDKKIVGKIDSMLVASDEGKTGLQIVDYKTGNTEIKKYLWPYSLNLQLPMYKFLAENCSELPPYELQGIYYLNFVNNSLDNFDDEVTYSEIIRKSTLKEGLFAPSVDLLNLYEKGVETTKIIKTIDVKKLEDINKKGITFDEGMNKYIFDAVDVFSLHFEKCEFPISPFYWSNSEQSSPCKFCSYKNICFKRPFDKRLRIRLDGYEDSLNFENDSSSEEILED